MLTAVHLDDEFALMAGEVRKERTDSGLSAKVAFLKGQRSKISPELSLSIGHIAP